MIKGLLKTVRKRLRQNEATESIRYKSIKVEEEYDEISSISQLEDAYRKVKGHKGVARIDGVTIEIFGENVEAELTKLGQELREWTCFLSCIKDECFE